MAAHLAAPSYWMARPAPVSAKVVPVTAAFAPEGAEERRTIAPFVPLAR